MSKLDHLYARLSYLEPPPIVPLSKLQMVELNQISLRMCRRAPAFSLKNYRTDNTPDDDVADGGEDLSVLESVKKEMADLVARQDRHETAALLLIPSGENHQA